MNSPNSNRPFLDFAALWDGVKKNLGILIVFVLVFSLTAAASGDGFLSAYNLQNLIRRAAPSAILGIGVTFVIVTGGIDLSIGSLICLNACVLQLLMIQQGIPIPLCLAIVVLMSVAVGFCHGLLITKVSLQPFVVTLCGLLIYRGVARWLTGDKSVGWQDQIRIFAKSRPVAWISRSQARPEPMAK